MLGLILSFLGSLINPIFKFLGAVQNTKTQQVIEEGTVATAIVQEQGAVQTKWWFAALIPPAFAIPFIILTWKLVIWDKILGWGSTEALGTTIGVTYNMVVGFYFLHVLGRQ